MPVFEDPAGVAGPELVWDAGLGRFLLAAGHGRGGGGEIGVFEGPSPWGPWGTIDYEDRWLGMTGGEFLGLRFPPVWMRDGGRTLWAVFSCWGPGACGPFHDRFNLIRATLTLGGAGAPTLPPTAGGGSDATPGTGDTGAPRGTTGASRALPPATPAAPRTGEAAAPATGSTPAAATPSGGTALPRPASPGPVTSAAAARPGPPEPSPDACRRIAENRGWTGIATAGRGPAAADGRGPVAVTGERDGEGRNRACRYDAGSGRARFDDQE